MSLHIHPDGCPTQPDMPRLHWDEPQDLDGLPALLHTLRAQGTMAISIGWDPMDAAGLSTLAANGFKTAGTGPWRAIGSDVHWVTGYEDATGATLDLIWSGG